MRKYGTDKPDLRNPLIIQDVTDIFKSPVGIDSFKIVYLLILSIEKIINIISKLEI